MEKLYKIIAFDRPQAITTVKQENFAKAKESILKLQLFCLLFKVEVKPH